MKSSSIWKIERVAVIVLRATEDRNFRGTLDLETHTCWRSPSGASEDRNGLVTIPIKVLPASGGRPPG
ncbi:hypothetical protein ACFRNT_32620 [Streptomyces sp. NPDC056697]|uniref:hypothetical protein n=1 Tax=Streptomyces sp. NPDC056697 TaxID=3345915 RepID=UPI00368FB148